MHSLHLQSFGTNAVGAKEEKQCGICLHVSYSICIILSGHTAAIKTAGSNAFKCQKTCTGGPPPKITTHTRRNNNNSVMMYCIGKISCTTQGYDCRLRRFCNFLMLNKMEGDNIC